MKQTTQPAKFGEFADVVTSIEQVHAVIGPPLPAVVAKVIARLDKMCKDFIAQSPFVVLATVGGDGHLDVSPKGDPPGFVRVLDDKHLAIPDRPGNRRVDTFHNLLVNPHIGLLFIIPGKAETLRVRGEARLVRDWELRESMTVQGSVPEFAIVVHVESVFFHCPKCMLRAHLWQPTAWPNAEGLADIGAAMVEHAKLPISPAELAVLAEQEGLTKLY